MGTTDTEAVTDMSQLKAIAYVVSAVTCVLLY